MSRYLNRKKITIFNQKNFLYAVIIIPLLFLFLIFYFNFNKVENYLIKYVNIFSNKFDYELRFFEVNGINLVQSSEIEKIIKPYLNSSIFLLPLNDISKKIRENPWIKSINISTNYKDILIININEFNPVGVFLFNDTYYYFNNNGKIIDLLDESLLLNDEFIVFSGQLSNINAISLLEILNQSDLIFLDKIRHAKYIGKRRWNLILDNGILLKLSEKNPKASLQNYSKLRKNLNNNELNSIKAIDLIDFQKAVIQFR